jgi:hypothetical protein
MAIHSAAVAFDVLTEQLDIPRSEEFRGVVFIPEDRLGQVMRREDVAVAVGYNGFLGKVCTMHVFIRDKARFTRQVIREAFRLPFQEWGMLTVLGAVDGSNTAALELDRRLGFKQAIIIAGGAEDGSDLHIMRMDRAECRWISEEPSDG